MTRTVLTLPDVGPRTEKSGALLAGLNAQHHDAFNTWASTPSYAQERMRLQPNTVGNARLIVSPAEVDNGIDLSTYPEPLLADESDFTRWRTPVFEFVGMASVFGEPPQSWNVWTTAAGIGQARS